MIRVDVIPPMGRRTENDEEARTMGRCDGCTRERWLYNFDHTFPWGPDSVWLCGDCAGLYVDDDDEEALS